MTDVNRESFPANCVQPQKFSSQMICCVGYLLHLSCECICNLLTVIVVYVISSQKTSKFSSKVKQELTMTQ